MGEAERGEEMSGPKSQQILSPDEQTAVRLYDAICENRREDAIEELQRLFRRVQFRSIREQHNLFPDRVPA